jgi:hypothetical protein
LPLEHAIAIVERWMQARTSNKGESERCCAFPLVRTHLSHDEPCGDSAGRTKVMTYDSHTGSPLHADELSRTSA